MNVKNIVEEFLVSEGYDGLYFPGECACVIGDLMPCDCIAVPMCEPGYKHPGDVEYDFYIKPIKPTDKMNGCRACHLDYAY